MGNPFPGFLLSGPNNGQAALGALQSVTNVNVLSSPQVLVLDNETARLQVGNLVPFLTTSSQSTITNGAPVINSIDYRGTGVIMEVTPRVNSGGLVNAGYRAGGERHRPGGDGGEPDRVAHVPATRDQLAGGGAGRADGGAGRADPRHVEPGETRASRG